MSSNPRTAIVAGAGLGGSLMAIYLARAGFRVIVVERRGDPRRPGVGAGKSINLAISARGFHGLRGVGLEQAVLDMAIPMRGRMLHDRGGKLKFQPYGTRPEHVIRSVSRLGLNRLLVEAAAEEASIEMLFEHQVLDVDVERAVVSVMTTAGVEKQIEGDFVVGADGAFSAVRAQMQRANRFQYSQYYLPLGYKELAIPAAEDGSHQLEAGVLHIWPRGDSMMIALPNKDGSFTCTLFWPFAGEGGFALPDEPENVQQHFAEHFHDAVPLMPTLVEDYLANPTSALVTIRCAPWHVGGRVVLLGDAAHAVVPFYGQGANASFEDCVVLDESLRAADGDTELAFTRYSELRKRHADAIADLAIENFEVMSNRVSSPLFQLGKKAEALAERWLSFWFVPLYTMISFSRIPYDDARQRAARQRRQLALGIAVTLVATLGLLAVVLI